MRLVRCGVLAAVLLLPAGSVHGGWVVDADGACVERWDSGDLLRGPTAIVNAPLLPLRTLAGSAQYAWNVDAWWPWQIAVLGPAVTAFGGAAGAVEAAWWVCTGLADTVTGGYFALSSDRAVDLSIAPDVPSMIADAGPPTPSTDRCGRPLAPPAAK